MRLSEVPENKEVVVSNIEGDTRFLTRITSIGITVGCGLKVVSNQKKLPLLIYGRDTHIAINRNESERIMVEVAADEK